MIKSGQSVTVEFTTVSPETGELEDADSTPTGTLVVNGTDNGASVTVTNKATGIYKAAVTLPTLTAGDVVSLRVAATVFGIPGASVVWKETADTKLVSELNDFDPANDTVGTVTNLTNLPAAAATAAELAKVPKSDGTASWNATALAAIIAEVDTALADYDAPTKAEMDSAVAPLATAAALATVDQIVDDILVDTGTTLPALISAGTGTGLYTHTITVDDGTDPLDGVLVQVATDSSYSNIIRSGYTNDMGEVTFNYDVPGTYYGRAEIARFNVRTFSITVS